MTIRKYLGEVFSDGHFIYFKYDAKRAKDCSSAEGGHRRRSRGGWSAVSVELRKAWFQVLPSAKLEMSPEEKSHFLHDYGIRAEGSSPAPAITDHSEMSGFLFLTEAC